MSFCIAQHNDIAREDIFAVEITVRIAKHRFSNLTYVIFVTLSVCFCARNRKIEVISFAQCCDFFFKFIECVSDTRNKLERMFYSCFFQQFFLSVSNSIQTICYGDVFIFHTSNKCVYND